MVLHVIWILLLFKITASNETIRPRSVNIALETILDFDKKNQAADVKFIDEVQSFLSKVRNVVDKKPQRRALNNNVHTMKFTEFLRELLELLKTYDNDDLEDVFAVIDDEIRKYHYKGCKFYELVEDPSLRRYVANKLNLVKEKPATDIRWKLNGMLQVLEDSKFNTKQTEVLDYTNSLFTRDDGLEFKRILDNMQNYRSKYKRANLDLVKLVKESIRTVIFDKYSSLNVNTRRDFKIKLETFWNQERRPDKYDLSLDMVNENQKYLRKEFKTTPFRIQDDFKSVFVFKDLATLTPHLNVKKDYSEEGTYIKQKDKSEKSINQKIVYSKNSESEDHESTSEKHDGDPVSVSENDDTVSEYRPESNDVLRKVNSDKVSSSSENYDDNESSATSATTSPIIKTTKKKKHHRSKTTFTTPMFINIDSDEFVRPEKIRYPSLFTNYGGKSKKKQSSQKTSPFATLHPEKKRTAKKRFKVESTTKTDNIRMQTLWQERIRPKNYHYEEKKNKDRKIDTVDDTHKSNKMSKSKITSHKNKDKSQRIKSRTKNRLADEKYIKGLENNHKSLRSYLHEKENEKTEQLDSGIDNQISFKLTSQKKKRPTSKKADAQHIKNLKHEVEQTLEETTTDEELDNEKRVDTSAEAELHTKRPTHIPSPRKRSVKIGSSSKKVKNTKESTESDSTILSSESDITSTEFDTSTGSDMTSTGSDITSAGSDNTSTGSDITSISNSASSSDDEITYDDSYSTSVETVEIIKEKTIKAVQRTQNKVKKVTKTKSESGFKAQKKSEESTSKDTVDDNKSITPIKQISEENLVYITTTAKISGKTITSPRPRYKMIEQDIKSSTLEFIRHKMVDVSGENKMFAPQYKLNRNIEKDSLSMEISKISEQSTEYEAEKIISNNLYKKLNKDIEHRTKLSEEGIAIESYENKLTKLRKSNDFDNFGQARPSLMHRIDLNYSPEETKRAQKSEPKEDLDFLSKQKQQFPTLPFWEGTTRNTATYKTTTTTKASTPQKKTTFLIKQLSENKSGKRIEQPVTLNTKSPKPLSTTISTTKHKSPSTLPTITQTTKQSSVTIQDNSTAKRSPDNTNSEDFYKKFMQNYFNGNTANINNPNANNLVNLDNAKLDIIPLANIGTATIGLGDLDWLQKDLTMTPLPPPTVPSPSTIFTKTSSNSDKGPNSSPFVTPFTIPATVSYPNMQNQELANQYSKSPIPPVTLNILTNTSMLRRNIPSSGVSNDQYSQYETTDDALDLDNILGKYELTPKVYGFEVVNKEGEQGTNSTTQQSFQKFMLDTTKTLTRPRGAGKGNRRKMKPFTNVNELPVKDIDINITDFDVGANLDLLL